jgi:hypothetical protein
MLAQARSGKKPYSIMDAGRLGLWLLLLGALLLGAPHPAPAQDIYYQPHPGMPRDNGLRRQEFLQMFSEPVVWPFTAAHIRTVGVTNYYARNAPPEELRRVTGFLASHHLELNVTIGAVATGGECGRGVEGMSRSADEGAQILRRFQSVGATVNDIALDEPLTYGFGYRGKEQCAYSIEEVARRVAATIQAAKRVYPNAMITDAEAATDHPTAEWLKILGEWLGAYRAATGVPLDYLALDMNWQRPYWVEEAASTVKFAHAHGVKVGIIINAQGLPRMTEQEWLAVSQHNMQLLWNARIPFDDVVFASWSDRPTRTLPETDPFSMTGLIDWYVRHRP